MTSEIAFLLALVSLSLTCGIVCFNGFHLQRELRASRRRVQELETQIEIMDTRFDTGNER